MSLSIYKLSLKHTSPLCPGKSLFFLSQSNRNRQRREESPTNFFKGETNFGETLHPQQPPVSAVCRVSYEMIELFIIWWRAKRLPPPPALLLLAPGWRRWRSLVDAAIASNRQRRQQLASLRRGDVRPAVACCDACWRSLGWRGVR